MNKKQLNRITKLRSHIKHEMATIANSRDFLRGYIDEIQQIIDDTDQADTDLQIAVDALTAATDKISEQL